MERADGAGSGEARRASLRSLGALKPYLFRLKGMLAAALVALVVSAAATLAVPLAVRAHDRSRLLGIDPGLIDKYFATLAGIGLILALSSAARFYAVNWLGERVVADIRRDVFAHLTELSPAFFEVSHSGEMMSRLTADTTQVKAVASTAISQTLRNILLLVGSAVMMIVTSPKLSLAVLIAIPIIVLPLVAYGRSVRKRSREAQDTLRASFGLREREPGPGQVMQAFTHEKAAAARFGSAVERVLRGRQFPDQGAGGADRHHHLPRLRERRRRLVVWRSGGAVGDHDRRQAVAVRALCRARGVGRRGLRAKFGATWPNRWAPPSAWASCSRPGRASHRRQIRSRFPAPPRGEIAFRDVSFSYPLRPGCERARSRELSRRAGRNAWRWSGRRARARRRSSRSCSVSMTPIAARSS